MKTQLLLVFSSNPYSGVDAQAVALELEALVNRHRRRAGLRVLTHGPALGAAARQHCQRMRNLGFFDHTDPADRSTAFERVAATARQERWRLVAENTAAGQWTASQVLDGWLSSPGHRANLERADVEAVGTAVALGGPMRTYITQLYASAQAPTVLFLPNLADALSGLRLISRRTDLKAERCGPRC